VKNYYELLEIASTSSADEVKRAFRQQIARYHPDKVQHLGKEFQAMAAERAAELTEAYRILSDEGRRAEYDRALNAGGQAAPVPPSSTAASPPAAGAAGPPPPQAAPEEDAPRGTWFKQERASRDEFVRKALVGRFGRALEVVAGDYDHAHVRGFDIACHPKRGLFGRGKGPQLLVRFVSSVDAESVAEAWLQAMKTIGANDEACVFLMGSAMATASELAAAIAAQRRKTRGAKVTLIPIDARDWDARMPTDAPPIAKTVLERLRSGA
jgi:curved DNA-binding protein CbpA